MLAGFGRRAPDLGLGVVQAVDVSGLVQGPELGVFDDGDRSLGDQGRVE